MNVKNQIEVILFLRSIWFFVSLHVAPSLVKTIILSSTTQHNIRAFCLVPDEIRDEDNQIVPDLTSSQFTMTCQVSYNQGLPLKTHLIKPKKSMFFYSGLPFFLKDRSFKDFKLKLVFSHAWFYIIIGPHFTLVYTRKKMY